MFTCLYLWFTVYPSRNVVYRHPIHNLKHAERPGFETLKAYRAKRVEQFSSAGILPGNGEEWWNIRSKAQQPFLKTKNVNNYVNVLGQIAEEFIDRSLIISIFLNLNCRFYTSNIWNNRIRLIRQENNEMKPDFLNDLYRWALECNLTF